MSMGCSYRLINAAEKANGLTALRSELAGPESIALFAQ